MNRGSNDVSRVRGDKGGADSWDEEVEGVSPDMSRRMIRKWKDGVKSRGWVDRIKSKTNRRGGI